MKKILIVVTSHDALGDSGRRTGLWLEEFTTPYYAFLDAGFGVTVASPSGGAVPVDPESRKENARTPSVERFETEKSGVLEHSRSLSNCSEAEFDAVFYPGGHGPMWDLVNNPVNAALLSDFVRAGKPVGAVCHGPAALLSAIKANGEPLVREHKITGFSNSEERAVGLDKIVPFLLEDQLKALGGLYSKGGDWTPYALADGCLVTGQNPQSAGKCAELLIRLLQTEPGQ